MLTARNVHAPIASGENADRKREIAFTHDPFMFFGDTLDAVARVARISVRGRNKMTNFIWTPGLMNLCATRHSFRHIWFGNAVGDALFVLMLMQEAGNLSSQLD